MKAFTGKIAQFVAAGLLCLGTATADAGMFVYQLPDGSRVVTSHKLPAKHYKLIRSGGNAESADLLAASLNPQYFRIDHKNYDSLIQHAAETHSVEPALLKAVMRAESAFNPYATSHKGASGLMQLMPATAERFGVTDIYDPAQNIQAGAEYLRFLLKKFKNNYRLAIAAYNAGEGTVMRYKGIPPYSETQQYVKKVMRYKQRYASVFKTDA